MDEERYPALPWQGWKIVKRLGRGGYGSVYLAQRNSAGVMEDAAVKVISFPKNEEDIEADFTDGYDLVSVRNKYKNMLHRYVDEYRFESLCICTKRQILFCQRNVPGVGGITIRWKYTRTAEA